MEIILQSDSEQASEDYKHRRLLLKTFIMRGFYNTLDILKGEFLQTLQQFDLLERFFSFLVNAID